MYRFKKMLIALDFSSKDETLIRYARHLSAMAESESIYFVHVAEHFDIPEDLCKEYPDLLEPVDEYALNRMKEIIGNHFEKGDSPMIDFKVTEGEPVSGILKVIRQNNIDLVLVGKPDRGPGQHNMAEKLARKATCSVLAVPEGSKTSYQHILLATDFSGHSFNALDIATAFARAARLKYIDAIHVYSLPLGYYKTGKSQGEFSEIMQKNAAVQYEQWLRSADLKDVAVRFEAHKSKNPGRKIMEYIRETDSDLLVMGTRGRSSGAAILLGSLTEQLIRESHIPVLAVKQKGAGMDLLDVILES